MELKQLFAGIEFAGALPQGVATGISIHSGSVQPGHVFVCIAGKHFNGHSAAAEALGKGALCVVVEQETGAAPQLRVPNTRAAYAKLCAQWFGNPAQGLTLVGITGTNGKTTTASLLWHICTQAGLSTGLLGTLKTMVGQQEHEATLTTPEAWELHSAFAQMRQAGCTHCIMEVSSQALAQQRVAGLHFAAGVFTNLTQDHLDYHGSLEAYAAAKAELFAHCSLAVLNQDDEAAARMVQGKALRTVCYSQRSNTADYTAKDVQLHATGVRFELVARGSIGRMHVAAPGAFSVYNAMAAAATALELGLGMAQVAEAVASFGGVKGRMERLPCPLGFDVLVDYAHTPDGLQNVLQALRQSRPGRVICVFGCGGDRDKTKRPQMGRVAAQLSDVVVVSSDNPRSEPPEAIIQDILAGMPRGGAQVLVEPERTAAVELALQKAQPGDVVLLAGKGQETYQVLASGKVHLDEREVVAAWLAAKTAV